MSHHYTESGLDNVYLLDGYTVHETEYGQGVSIDDTEGLHRAIGRWLIETPKTLNGAELRFLRLEMELSQNRFAAIIGSTEQNVRRWEKTRRRHIPGPADRLMRVLYNEYAGGDGSVRRMVDRLAELDEIRASRIQLSETKGRWKVVPESCAAVA